MHKILRNRALSVLSLAATILLVALACGMSAFAQTLTTGAISGTVKDPTGAVVPNATVTVTNVGTGAVRTTLSNASGEYVIPQLNPGQYKVKVAATGFREEEVGPVTVAVSQVAMVDVRLEVGRVTQLVEVTAQAAIISTDNPNTTTNLSASQLDVIPNPGADLSYEANFAPGAVMNTTSGYGNTEFNGMSSISNNFTIDGLDANDPFLNLNNSGATDLQLGLYSMQEVTVNTSSYSVDQGRMPAAQINYVTKSGSNNWHGNASEIWNGTRMNAADYFTNSHMFESPAPTKPFTNVNEFDGAVGGPIKHDKLFFFTDLEGIRIVLPVVGSATTPSANYETYTTAQLALGGCDYQLDPGGCAAGTSSYVYSANPKEAPYYQTIFSLYGNKGGTPVAAMGCPLNPDGSLLPIPSPATGYTMVNGSPVANVQIPDGTGCTLSRTFALTNKTGETLWTIKVDHNVNSSNTVWYRFVMDNGLQAAYTDPINAAFNEYSDQPERSNNAGWTHTFSPNMVNQFNPGWAWYRALWLNTPQATATFPTVLYGPANYAFTTLGGEDMYWPEGRNVMQWQLNDNLSWTKGRNEFKFGANLRRVLVSDHDFGTFDTPMILQASLPEFTYGVTDYTYQAFAKSLDEPFGIVNLDSYFMDTMKATPKLTLTLGIRAAWNSDPVDQHSLISRLNGSFYNINHDVDQPLNSVITPGLSTTFAATPKIMWQPRVAFAYRVRPNTVLRGGFGVFSDIFPASLADSMATNPPFDNTFNEGLFGLDNGTGIAPGVPGSAISAAINDNQHYVSLFNSGTLSCASTKAAPFPNCIPQASIAAVENYTRYPYDLEYSFGIERQFGANWGLDVKYQGTQGRQIPYNYDPNGAETLCQGCYAPYPYYHTAPAQSPDPRFAGVTQWTEGGNSGYNALQVTGRKRMSHGFNFELNYTWSHCLDTTSNGISPFDFLGVIQDPAPGELYRDHGPCDFDFRHVLNGFYAYQLPFHTSNAFLNKAISGWQLSGSIFYHTGQPFSILSSTLGGTLINTSGAIFANRVPGQPLYNKANIGTDCVANPAGCITTAGNVQWLNPNAFLSTEDTDTTMCVAPVSSLSGVAGAVANGAINSTLCQSGNMQRNFLRGPRFSWEDFFLTKKFKLTEHATFSVDGQFYNVFNHPNFATFGNVTAGTPGDISTLHGFGNISGMSQPPTGLLGSGFGQDTSVRMIAFRARLEF
jgi:hypothetical protein